MEDDKLIDRLERKRDGQRIKEKRKSEEHSAEGGVFDKFTSVNLSKLIAKGVIKEFVGIISSGKEANVYYALGRDGAPIAVKIYKIDPQNTKWMKNYIIGDPRFHKIGNSTHKIIYTWCKKEYKNLRQMLRHGINVPEPIESKDNILVMAFIGEDNGSPAKKLKEVEDEYDYSQILTTLLTQIETMYCSAHLVHGDLSEYNILMFHGHPVIIDVSQAVSVYHMNAPIFLLRDVINVIKFFENKISKDLIPNPEEFTNTILQKAQNNGRELTPTNP